MHKQPKISVIICTHNPRQDYLARVLQALRRQTLPFDDWELLIVDNASKAPITEHVNLSWHPSAKVVSERSLGLTHARLRGIRETSGSTLVFVDDDNVLSDDYLAQVLTLFTENASVGACSGNALPEFETEPASWLEPYLPFLGIRIVKETVLTRTYFDWAAMPIGAGLCIRRSAASAYVDLCSQSETRQGLDRSGSRLTSGGDNDLAMVAIDLGFSIGLSPKLSLTHLIPANRCTESYITSLMEGITYSAFLLGKVRGEPSQKPRRSLRERAHLLKMILTRTGVHRKVVLAERRAFRAFLQWEQQQRPL